MNFVHGKPKSSGKRAKPAPVQEYPERHFLKVMDAGSPPRFESQIERITSQQERAAQLAGKQKSGWMRDGGTVLMPGTPAWDRPGWM